ncbi:MAG: molybdopterin-dependent oxidoreductase [Rhodospirillaceae bacterium]|nr:molybdopterin-dependent oxidoreductase [Rhodospirillaceae bacterium]MBL6930289.1 molybdopterin-dependent oxidoreductase [Rhodospirillales bacterium]
MVDRRNFIKLGIATAGAQLLPIRKVMAEDGTPLKHGGEDYSQFSGNQHVAVPSICGQCPSRCAILGYLDDGKLAKIEGHPDSIRNQGRVCAKGQAGAAKVYDPDRILTPLRRVGPRGQGEWEKISWDEALDELTTRLKKFRDAGTPEKFVFHHGWISDSAEKLIDDVFLASYGTGSIIKQTCQQQSARWTAHELTWGATADNWDFDNARYVLNFGSNVLEAHTNFVSLAKRLTKSTVDHDLKMMTFDVRLSNTAANSDRWIPIKPGTDLAVVLAMCNVVMSEDLYGRDGEKFIDFCLVSENYNALPGEKIVTLKKHLADYTPEWAEKISGVAAQDIRQIAREFAITKPACIISSRGAAAHYNGVQTERAIQMLAAITGNIDNPGGRCQAVSAQWTYPTGPKSKPVSRKLSFIDDIASTTALPQFGAGHSVLRRIKESGERPGLYMWYHHNPAYANGSTRETVEILKDESLLPFTVAVTPFYDETAALADLILPDATYLERYDIEAAVSPGQVPEYALRQPFVEPQGEARDFKDVCCELAKRLDIKLGFKSAEKFIDKACKLTIVVKKKARGFRGMQKIGVWHDKKAQPIYFAYRERIENATLADDGVLLDEATGVYWNWKTAEVESEAKAKSIGYLGTPGAFKGYVAQRVGYAAYSGFRPGILNKTGLFELYSPLLAAKGMPGLPTYVEIPDHVKMSDDEMILTTFKVNVQSLSNTGNGGWLTEIHHENPVWINPVSATARGIIDGDALIIKSPLGEVSGTAMVTPTVAPGVLAVSTHLGRWQGGRYASGNPAPFALGDHRHDEHQWWQAGGTHANWIIPDNPEPVSGQQCWMDTVVTLEKASS